LQSVTLARSQNTTHCNTLMMPEQRDMGGAAVKLMELDEFFVWQLGQDVRYELVDGVPVEMMAGASGLHDTIAVNIMTLLRTQLRGTGCFVRTADTAIRTKIRSLRRADALITCEPPRADSYEAKEARFVLEVLSPTNTGTRWDRKMAEYRRLRHLQYILVVDSQTYGATLHVRTDDGWDHVEADLPDDVIELASLGCSLKIADIYDETGLEPVHA
jgi:Uma2 family endonuclease